MIKANPMPHYGVPFKPKAPEQRHVEVCPFSFDSRDRERWMQKEKKIEELQKEEVGAGEMSWFILFPKTLSPAAGSNACGVSCSSKTAHVG